MAVSKTTIWGITAAAGALVSTVPLCISRLEQVFGAGIPVWMTQSLTILQIAGMLIAAVGGALFAVNSMAYKDIKPEAAENVLKQPEKAEEPKP